MSDEANSNKGSVMGFVIKSSILMVDSFCIIEKTVDGMGGIEIYNDVCEFENEDFDYLFFRFKSTNCSCNVVSYHGVNSKEVLRTHKLLCISDSFDIFPFTLITALKHYNKIKKLCKENTITLKLSEYKVQTL